MLTSAVIYKQRPLHENVIALSKAILESSAKNVKNNYRKTTRSFLPAAQFVTTLNV